MNVQDYIQQNKLDEVPVLTDEFIADHIRKSDLPEEEKQSLLTELMSDEEVQVSSGLRNWLWYGAILIILIIAWFVLK
jgi:hypothetical protein